MNSRVADVKPENFLGGGYNGTINISGGYIENYQLGGYYYAVYYGNNGGSIVLDGVNVNGNTLIGQQSNTACYFNGQIRIGPDFTNFGFSDLMHEYGHYLQSQSMNGVAYFFGAVGSALSVNDPNHLDKSFEQQASLLGGIYADTYYND